MTDNPLQHVISLPLTLLSVVFILIIEHHLIKDNGTFLVVGFFSFVLVVFLSFLAGEKTIDVIERRINNKDKDKKKEYD